MFLGFTGAGRGQQLCSYESGESGRDLMGHERSRKYLVKIFTGTHGS